MSRDVRDASLVLVSVLNQGWVFLDANTGAQLNDVIPTPMSPWDAAQIMPTVIATTGDDPQVSLFQVVDSLQVRKVGILEGHNSGTRGICQILSSSSSSSSELSNDNIRFATGSLDSSVKIWQVDDQTFDGTFVSTLDLGGAGSVWSLDSFSGLICAAAESSVQIWDLDRASVLTALPPLDSIPTPTRTRTPAPTRSTCLAHHDGLGLLFVGDSSGTVRFVDMKSSSSSSSESESEFGVVRTLSPLSSLRRKLRSYESVGLGDGSIDSIVVEENEREFELVLTCSSGEVFVYDLRKSSGGSSGGSGEICFFRAHDESKLMFGCSCRTEDSLNFVTSSSDGFVKCWKREWRSSSPSSLLWEYSAEKKARCRFGCVTSILCDCGVLSGADDVSAAGAGAPVVPDLEESDPFEELLPGGPNREILSVHVGTAGTRVGMACWELFCWDHGIQVDGTPSRPEPQTGEDRLRFFSERRDGKVAPRAVFLDLNHDMYADIVTGTYRAMFFPRQFVHSRGNAAGVFARGRACGRPLVPDSIDLIRRLVEKCSAFEGFLVFNGVGGGSGSGFGSLLLQHLSTEFDKKCKMGFPVYPSPCLSTAVVEPYNSVLATHHLLEHLDVTSVFENEALFDITRRNLRVARPSYRSVNRLLAHVVSSVTSTLRFDAGLNTSLAEFQANLVPFPRLHFLLNSYAPILSAEMAFHEQLSLYSITQSAFEPMSMMVKCDPRHGLYLASCLLYLGDVVPKDVNTCLGYLKGQRTIRFVDWAETGLKCGICFRRPSLLPGADMAMVQRALLVMSNSTAVGEMFARNRRIFDQMFSRRAFVHFYLTEGMEEDEFTEARDDVVAIERDYAEVADEDDDDEADEDDEEEDDDDDDSDGGPD